MQMNKIMYVVISLVFGVVLLPVLIGVLGNTNLSETALTDFPGARALIVLLPLIFVGMLLFIGAKAMKGGGSGKGEM